jgi:addiction module HigA family antidote
MLIPKYRDSTRPGEMLLEEFLIPMGITQKELAESIGVPFQRVNEIIRGKRGITPSTALRLSKFFGTSAGFWLNMQMCWDLQKAEREESAALDKIKLVEHSRLATS